MTKPVGSKVKKTYRSVKLRDGRTVQVAVVKVKRDAKKEK